MKIFLLSTLLSARKSFRLASVSFYLVPFCDYIILSSFVWRLYHYELFCLRTVSFCLFPFSDCINFVMFRLAILSFCIVTFDDCVLFCLIPFGDYIHFLLSFNHLGDGIVSQGTFSSLLFGRLYPSLCWIDKCIIVLSFCGCIRDHVSFGDESPFSLSLSDRLLCPLSCFLRQLFECFSNHHFLIR